MLAYYRYPSKGYEWRRRKNCWSGSCGMDAATKITSQESHSKICTCGSSSCPDTRRTQLIRRMHFGHRSASDMACFLAVPDSILRIWQKLVASFAVPTATSPQFL